MRVRNENHQMSLIYLDGYAYFLSYLCSKTTKTDDWSKDGFQDCLQRRQAAV